MEMMSVVMVFVVLPITFLWAVLGVGCGGRPGRLPAIFKLVLGCFAIAFLTQHGVAEDARLIFLTLAVATSFLGAADIVAMKTAALVKGTCESVDSVIENHKVS